jgi:hypothetical protein
LGIACLKQVFQTLYGSKFEIPAPALSNQLVKITKLQRPEIALSQFCIQGAYDISLTGALNFLYLKEGYLE